MSFEKLNDQHVPASGEIFLDTSIHCSRLKGTPFRERIDSILSLFQWQSTSTYTLVEFGNVVLATAEYYLRKLDELKSLEKVRSHIGNVLQPQWHQQKITWAFNLLNEFGKDDSECTERARLSLRRLMKTGLAFVEQQCDQPLANGTECYWAQRGVRQRNDGRLVWTSPKCSPDHKRCRVDDFFLDHLDTFKRIKTAIDGLPDDKLTKQLRGFSEVIGQAEKDPTVLLDYRTGCKRMADAIIAVESLPFRNFFSQNIAESEILTRVLEQTFYYLPPNDSKGVLVRLSTPEVTPDSS